MVSGSDGVLGPHNCTTVLIRDRDRSYGRDFIRRAARIGIETLPTLVQAPKANALAERVIGTIRRDCTDHIIVLNEKHLRRVLLEYVIDYNKAQIKSPPGI